MDCWLNFWCCVCNSEEGLFSFEICCLCVDGSWLLVDVLFSFLCFGMFEYLVVFFSDVIECCCVCEVLQESEVWMKGIVFNVLGMVFCLECLWVGVFFDFVYISEGSEVLVGYSVCELIESGCGICGLVYFDDCECYWLSQMVVFDENCDWYWQGCIFICQGELCWVDIKVLVCCFEDGCVVWDGVVWDIIVNKQIEFEFGELCVQFCELLVYLELVWEEEKVCIVCEVYDELGQVLMVLKLEISMCELVYVDVQEGLCECLGNMKKLIVQLFQLVCDVVIVLCLLIFDVGIGLVVEWQVWCFEVCMQIFCLVEVLENLLQLVDVKVIGLFCIFQEVLINVMWYVEVYIV